ncbi:hypothetical protein Tco_0992691 [Tanacetum coccineum]|uniref:Uncharacterized protein n=1 Tax=Tanacetum coccineum TaxID=301880 RepID=A0ABQ5F4A7_9ASTR
MGLEYNNGNYVAHPSTNKVKSELVKIATHEALVQKTPMLKSSFPVAWRILMTFFIQVHGGNHSSTKHVNSSQQLIIYSLLTGTNIDIREIINNDLVTRLMAKSRKNQSNFSKNASEVTPIELTAFMIDVINHENSVSLLVVFEKTWKKKTQTVTKPKPKSHGLEISGARP